MDDDEYEVTIGTGGWILVALSGLVTFAVLRWALGFMLFPTFAFALAIVLIVVLLLFRLAGKASAEEDVAAQRVRRILADPSRWGHLPPQVRDWLSTQRWASVLPDENQMLVETFPRADKFYMVCYPFEGRLAQQTLGMLLTRRLERLGARPLGFTASEYALVVWGLRDMGAMIAEGRLSLARLFDEDMLGDDLEAWLAESNLMKRTFRNVAIIAGLIERRIPGKEKTTRQVTVNTDLIYDALRSHQPDHVLLRAAWDDAAEGLIDVHRLGGLLKRIKNQILHRDLERVSPLAVPVLLEIGRESIQGSGDDALLAEAAEQLMDEAVRLV